MASRRRIRSTLLQGKNKETELGKYGIGFGSFHSDPDTIKREHGFEPISELNPEELIKHLSPSERNLIMKVLNLKGECDKSSIKEFLKLDPGIREFRTLNFISSLWTEGSWKSSIEGGQVRNGKYLCCSGLIEGTIDYWKETANRLSTACHFRKPTRDEMYNALQPNELTENQRQVISFVQKKDSTDLTFQDIIEFSSYVSALDDISRENLWRQQRPSAYTLASIIYKSRFSQNAKLTNDEAKLIESITHKPEPQLADISNLKKCFLDGFKNEEQWNNLLDLHNVMIQNNGNWLFSSVRSNNEYYHLLQFLGLPYPQVRASLKNGRGFSKGSENLAGDHANNDDSFTSIDIQFNNRIVRLDACFDGIGSHGVGYIASGIAKETFEIAALAGWIKSVEDVRFISLLSDIIINLEKIKHLPKDKRKMGTTAVVSFVDGEDFYCINAGDSSSKVISGGKIIFSTALHNYNNTLLSGLGIGPNPLDINNNPRFDYKPIKLPAGAWVLTVSDKIGDTLCDHEFPLLLDGIENDNEAIQKIAELASKRLDRTEQYPLMCNCDPIKGKDDDLTIVVNHIK